MPYYATGESRDSYITGVRPGARYGATHDVEKRRDNLPDNVFSYIRAEVEREACLERIDADSRAKLMLDMLARKPKPRTANADVASAAMEHLERETQVRDRQAALLQLYAQERAEWEEQLGARGLATQRK